MASFGSGGAESLVVSLTKEFIDNGHTASVVVLVDSSDIGASETFEVARKAELSSAGATITSLSLPNRRNIFVGAKKLRSAIKSISPDIIHVHTPQALVYLLLLRPKCKIVYTHHNVSTNFPPFLFRLFDHIVSAYVAISPQCRNMLRKHVNQPLIDIKNGVSANFALPQKRISCAIDPIILSVGLLSAQKNYPLLITAAKLVCAELAQQNRHPKFKIVGGGDNLAEYRQQVSDLGLSDYIEFLGTRTDVAALMASADMMVNSSLWEGLPIALIEAAMAGLPIVATDVGGNCEVVIDGHNGKLVASGEQNALAEAIIEIASPQYDYTQSSQNSVAVGSEFTIDVCAGQHLELYHRLLPLDRS